jgi:DNA-binding GntR family transcriptional regulator
MDLSSLEPVERRSTAAIVADRIRSAIMQGTFPPGTQLGEVELAGRLGVSRGPLREAMQHLVAEGLLRSERHRGLFVRDLDAADVRDIHHARASVERAAGLLLIDGDRAAAADRLDAAVAGMAAAAASGDPVAVADADHAFHTLLVAASGSPRLRRMADGLLVETRMCLAALQDNPPPPAGLVGEHQALADAIRQGNADSLTAALDAHMSDAVTRLLTPRPAIPA